MGIIIQKYGGTSVATPEGRARAIEHILMEIEQGNKVVVVVSAIGRKGEPYATDSLIRFAKDIYEDIDARELDILMSCGEIISSVILVNTMAEKGIKGRSLTGSQAGILTDNSYGDAEVLSVDPSKIYKILDENKIPVICGFQGITEDGDITTFGRGGSDTTASIIGEAIQAERIDIFTDVDGIMTTDPKICEKAKVIDQITYHEVFQMADAGAKVIHPKAVEIAMRANIPLTIKNTFANKKGTTISRYAYSINHSSKNNKEENLIRGIAYIPGRTQVCLENIEIKDDLFFIELAKLGVSIDMINIFPERKAFTVSTEDISKVVHVLDTYGSIYHLMQECCKITLIGEKMRGVPGIMARILHALDKQKIKVLQTADSHTTISLLINYEDTIKAVNALHMEFKLNL